MLVRPLLPKGAMRLSLGLLGTTCLLLAACSTGNVDGSTCAGDDCSAEGAALESGTLVSCARKAGVVTCTYTPPVADFPIHVDALSVISATADGRLALDADSPTGTLSSRDARFLVSVDLSSKTVELRTARSLSLWMELADGQAVSYALPFSVWNVRLQGSVALINATLAKRTISLAPFEASPSTKALEYALELPIKSTRTLDLALLVADGTVLEGQGDFCYGGCNEQVAFRITGPGTYEVTKSGLAKVATSAPMDGGVDGAVAPKSCGVEGKPPCAGQNTCDAGYVITSLSEGLCHACGKEGQPQCVVSGKLVCDAGFVITSLSEGLCHACGKEGQPQCVVSGKLVCDTGFVITSLSEGLCHACGKLEQPACLVSGAYVCEAGLHRRISDGLCYAD